MIPIKWHHTPGDVPKSIKIRMMEGTHPHKSRAKSFRKMIRARLRAVLRERTQNEIRETTP
jgi:hypothetical protein